MRAVVVGLIALPAVVGGLAIAAAVVIFSPTQAPSAIDQEAPVASAIPGADWPDDRGGTAIEGTRPHLTVSDGTRTVTLPGAIPAMLTLVPAAVVDLPPLSRETPGQDGLGPDGATPAVPAAPPDPGPADAQPPIGGQGTASAEGRGSADVAPPINDQNSAEGGPSGAEERPDRPSESRPPAQRNDRDGSRGTPSRAPSKAPSSSWIETPRNAIPGHSDDHHGVGRPSAGEPGAQRPPKHLVEHKRPGHAGTSEPSPHASYNDRGHHTPGGPGGHGHGRGSDNRATTR